MGFVDCLPPWLLDDDLLLLGLFFQLFDHLVQLGDDVVFLRAHPLAGPAETQPPLDVVHHAGDFVQRIRLQRLQVRFHQPRQHLEPFGNLALVLHQAGQRRQAGLLLQQPMMADALVEQQRGRIDDLGRAARRRVGRSASSYNACCASQRPNSNRKLFRTSGGSALSCRTSNAVRTRGGWPPRHIATRSRVAGVGQGDRSRPADRGCRR